jgi:hypothetical protein
VDSLHVKRIDSSDFVYTVIIHAISENESNFSLLHFCYQNKLFIDHYI